jgi:hypothetical protein
VGENRETLFPDCSSVRDVNQNGGAAQPDSLVGDRTGSCFERPVREPLAIFCEIRLNAGSNIGSSAPPQVAYSPVKPELEGHGGSAAMDPAAEEGQPKEEE